MVTHTIDSPTFKKMIQMGAANLANNKEMINKLNVFPVPDGDTGTNMNLSLSSGVAEVNNVADEHLPAIVNAFVKGLLMGARGNSGVILSQLFRGFQTVTHDQTELGVEAFALALDHGVKVAYQSVTNPVEGTILTVAKDAANKAVREAKTTSSMTALMESVVREAKQSLARTPDLLPVLKEVGVVDSGGQGLVTIYEGFLAVLNGEEIITNVTQGMEQQIEEAHAAQSYVDPDSITFGYCTEFFVELDADKQIENPFNENDFRDALSAHGDSLLVATVDDIVKIHIHTEYPGKVMTLAQNYGQLTKIDIENMRKQYEEIVEEKVPEKETAPQPFGILAVAFGEGIKEMLTSMGASTVIEGGQTMNPSTEDILLAIEKTNADCTFILPNNKNIILAAEQASQLSDKEIIVIPTKSIPQGISALFAFEAEETKEANEENMLEAAADVKTGSLTYAIRDTILNDMEIKQGSYMGLNDDTIKVTHPDKITALKMLLIEMVNDEDELVTVFYGDDVTTSELAILEEYAEETFDEVEVEFYNGKQPIYSFILMIE